MARALAVLLLMVVGGLALAAAGCNDEGDFLLDDNTEATGTPPFFQRSPEPSPTPSPVGSPVAPGATPVASFDITVDSATNKRTQPTTDGDVAGTMSPGDTATVIAQISGEAVQADNDVWYQLDDGSFVYSGVVQKVEPPAGEGTPQEGQQ